MPLVNYSDSEGSEHDPEDEEKSKNTTSSSSKGYLPASKNTTTDRELNVRTKFRTAAMKELIEGKTSKKRRYDDDEDDDDNYDVELRFQRAQSVSSSNSEKAGSSLIAMLPQPRNDCSSVPAFPIESMLRMPDRINLQLEAAAAAIHEQIGSIQDLSVERGPQKSRVAVLDPTAKRKNQITYLAQRAELSEIKVKDELAMGRTKRQESRAKYGF